MKITKKIWFIVLTFIVVLFFLLKFISIPIEAKALLEIVVYISFIAIITKISSENIKAEKYAFDDLNDEYNNPQFLNVYNKFYKKYRYFFDKNMIADENLKKRYI